MCCGEGARRCAVDKTLYRRERAKPTKEERQKSANKQSAEIAIPFG